MGFVIENGRGDGNTLEIDSEGRARTFAITETEDKHINTANGKLWSVPFTALNPTGNNDYVVYIKNTGSKNLNITDFRFASSAATQIQINSVTGTASGGSSITPIVRNLGSNETPSATIESGTNITGLTSSGTIFFMNCPVADTLYHLSTTSNIIIPKGKAIGVLIETGTANLTGVISIAEAE
jgi:hypothetical protein